jgi:hypothetical protein
MADYFVFILTEDKFDIPTDVIIAITNNNNTFKCIINDYFNYMLINDINYHTINDLSKIKIYKITVDNYNFLDNLITKHIKYITHHFDKLTFSPEFNKFVYFKIFENEELNQITLAEYNQYKSMFNDNNLIIII